MERNDDRLGQAAGSPLSHGSSGRDELVAIMDRLADGDEAAAVTLYDRFGARIAAAVQRVARERPGGPIERGDLDDIVFEVCFEMMAVAKGWSPEGGALPWVWARHRVANVVDRMLGHVTDPLDEQRLADSPAGSAVVGTCGVHRTAGSWSAAGGGAEEASMSVALEWVVPDLTRARLLHEAIEAAAISERDCNVMFEYAYEKASGNRAPAATVAAAFDMKEAAVRQVFRRARARLRDLIASDERYAPLAELPLLA